MSKQPSNTNNKNCKIHVLPPTISDDDINALFLGLVNIIKKKFELEMNSEIINTNIAQNQLKKEIDIKNKEIARLKNEIIFLKSNH